MTRWTKRQLAEHEGKAPKAVRQSAGRKTGKPESEIEAMLDQQMKAYNLPKWENNYQFLSDRKWEFDRCWVHLRCAVDVQGHVHRIKRVFEADIVKGAMADFHGWTLLRVSGKTIRSGEAIEWIRNLLKRAEDKRAKV